MPYNVRYSDTNKGIIVVEDLTVNDETSLFLPGKRSTGYGQYVAENFLHLLENFAKITPPVKPVEGQLWYDTTEGIDQLKIYDGTGWVSASGLKKGTQAPSVTNSVRGDLWSNTETQQLYIFTGADWILVGPEYADGLLTGAKSETVIGIDNKEYAILFLKVQDKTLAIISQQSFIPKSSIPGFIKINAGFNISTLALSGTDTIKYWGIAEKAEALQVTNDPQNGVAVIPANNFLRKDVDAGKQNINVPIEIRNNEGIKIGESSQISLYTSGNSGILQNNITGSSISIRTRDGNFNRTVIYVDSAQRVGINNTAPEEDVDIKGNLKIRPKDGSTTEGRLIIDNTLDSTQLGVGSIVTKGGASIAKNLVLGGNALVTGSISHSGNIVGPANISNLNNGLDIGSNSGKYNAVWATTFNGNLAGNVTGSVTGNVFGSADRLSSATTFSITGDVDNNSFSFDGQTGGTLKQFNVRISNSFISNKQAAPNSSALGTDEILINRTDIIGGNAGVFKITKDNFLKDVPITPIGTIVPYGGEAAPTSWLLCQGAVLRKADYNELWKIIGHRFLDPSLLPNNGDTTFALPDFRGRVPLGLDSMGGIPANRVTDIAADSIGGVSGSESKDIQVNNLPEHEHTLRSENRQYYTVRVAGSDTIEEDAIPLPIEVGAVVSGSSATGVQGYTNSGGVQSTTGLNQPINVMNPYLALNYIIYTGK